MASVDSVNTASKIQMDYMKLLVTQLQNQNPLEPLDNNEMASQLAQFSQLEQLESMNSSFAKALSTSERTYANSLIDKNVAFTSQNEEGATEIKSGVVEQVVNDVDGKIMLVAGSDVFALEDVVSVRN